MADNAVKYKAQRDEMQRVCGFHSPQEAWDAIESHNNPTALYEKLLAGLKSKAGAPSDYGSDPDAHQAFIQSRCGFTDQPKAFAALGSHKHWKDFYRVLAQSMADQRHK